MNALRVAEISSVPFAVMWTQCSTSASVLIAGVLTVPPRRKGIPCSTVTPPHESIPELSRRTNKIGRIVGLADKGSMAGAREKHDSASRDVKAAGKAQKHLLEFSQRTIFNLYNFYALTLPPHRYDRREVLVGEDE